MTRPLQDEVQNGSQGWDATVNDNFTKVFGQPFPIAYLTPPLDESDLAATYPAAQFENCLIWVDHSTNGWTLYHSDGSTWADFSTRLSPVGVIQSFVIAASDEGTVLTSGAGKVKFRMPYAFTVTAVKASLTTASSSGALTIDIHDSGTTIFSTKITIDQGETTSATAATPAVISDSALADDAEISIDIDSAGADATGLKVTIIGVKV